MSTSGFLFQSTASERIVGYVRFLTAALLALWVALPGRAWADDTTALIEALASNPSHKVRIKAAQKLSGVRRDAVREALIGALGDDNALVRAAAAHALRKQPHATSVAGLCRVLGDSDDFVRRSATRALDTLGGAGGCPAMVRLEVSGDTPEMRAHLTEQMRKKLGEDTQMRVVDGVPAMVSKGKIRGYELKLRLDRTVERSATKTRVTCAVTQSIFDLKLRALRGSATQRGALELDAGTPDEIISRHFRACVDAVVPVLHRGMSDFLARSRR